MLENIIREAILEARWAVKCSYAVLHCYSNELFASVWGFAKPLETHFLWNKLGFWAQNRIVQPNWRQQKVHSNNSTRSHMFKGVALARDVVLAGSAPLARL